MILHLLILRLKTDAQKLKKPGTLLGALFSVLLVWFYGWGVAQIYSGASESAEQLTLYRHIETMIISTIFGITMVRMVLPTYQPLKQLFPKHYPISPWQRYHASIVNDLYRMHAVYFLLFLTVTFCYTHNTAFYATGLSAYFGATLLRRSFQYLIDFRLKRQAYGATFLAYGGLATPFIMHTTLIQPWYVLALILTLLYGIGFYQCNSTIGIKQHKGTYLLFGNAFKLIFNNPKARNPLIYGIVLKTCFLLGNYYMLTYYGSPLFGNAAFYWLFASPLLIFTYVFNNTWAFWKPLWLSMELRTDSYSTMMRQALKMMLIPMALDALVTIPILILTRNDHHFWIPFYLTLAIFLPMQAFMWSLFLAKNIQSTAGMKGRMSRWSSITSALSVLLLTVLSINYWFYILIPVYLLGGYISFYLSKSMYQEKKYKLAEVLLKE